MRNWNRIAGRKSAVLIMLLVMSFIIGNRVFFVHTHLDRYGNIVTHYHPYNKGSEKAPLKSHHHTDAVLALIGTADQTVIQSSLSELLISDFPAEQIGDTYLNSYTLPALTGNTNRGPPEF